MVVFCDLELNTQQNYFFLSDFPNIFSPKHFHSFELADADIADLADLEKVFTKRFVI